MRMLILLIGLGGPALMAAQTCDYQKLFSEGQAFAKQRQYKKALYKYNSARRCDPGKGDAVDVAIEALLAKVEGEKTAADVARIEAVNALSEAQEQKKDALFQKKIAEINKAKSDSAVIALNEAQEKTKAALLEAQKQQEKNIRIINSLYFYSGRYAVANKLNNWGYIDKNGNTMIPYKYTKANPFDQRTGLALVQLGNYSYYIDTLGNEYRICEKASLLDTFSHALEVHNHFRFKFPKKISRNKQLKILIYPGGRIRNIPGSIGNLTNLEFLDLSNNDIHSISPKIAKLSKLKWLSLSNNWYFYDIPPYIGELKSLETLELFRIRHLKEFPESIGNLEHLHRLILSFTPLNKFPNCILKLNDLQFLDLSYTGLTNIPLSLSELKQLKYVNASGNNITIENINQLRSAMPWCKIDF